MQSRIVGVDLGGTRMRAALLDGQGHLLERVEAPTLAHEGPDVVIPRLLDLIASVVPSEGEPPARAIGFSAPGPVDPILGTVVAPPNLPGWYNVPLRRIVQERFHLPTFLGNDANVAALAEVYQGAAQGHKNAIYLTISTGIGGGIVIDGRLFEGATGIGAEVGHMIMVVEGDRASSLEKEAAGPAMARRAVARIQAGESSRITEMVGGDLSAVTGKTVGDAALAGDALALDVVRHTGRLIGYGITSLMHLFNPTIFVIGGGVSTLGDLLFDPMREAIRQHALAPAYWEHTPIVLAALGDDVAIIGAATLALRRLEEAASGSD